MLKHKKRAVVVGGGLSGLLIAKAISNKYQVIIIEQGDSKDMEDMSKPRPDIPQGHHLHILLKDGYEKISEIVPDWDKNSEISYLDWGQDVKFYGPQGLFVRSPSPVVVPTASRPFYEYLIRKKVLEDPNISIQFGTKVLDFVFNEKKVEHIMVKKKESGEIDSLQCDLVFDCTGRHNKAINLPPNFDRPKVIDSPSMLTYSSATVRTKKKLDWKMLYIAPRPSENFRGGVACPQENGNYTITLSGYGKYRPPNSLETCLEFTKDLCSQDLYEFIKDADSVSNFRSYRNVTNRRLDFSDVRAWPSNLFLCGDSLAYLNPFYAQGMTIAARQALILRESLDEIDNFQLQRQLDRVIDGPWKIANSIKLKKSKSKKVSMRAKIIKWWYKKLLQKATYDSDARDLFHNINHMKTDFLSLKGLKTFLLTTISPNKF